MTDLILHTISKTQKSDLLEAMEELFSRENLEDYPMTETDWQEIFLILLNSYLRSHASNRKEMFKRLTAKLHLLRRMEHRRSSDPFPSISITSPSTMDSVPRASESDSRKFRAQQFHFGTLN